MFSILLLASGSLVCLALSLYLLFKRRAFAAALLQKENWLGYALLSAALGIAGWRGFVTFSHAYELQGQTLAVHWRILLGNEAVPLLYGLFALMVAACALWRRTRPLPFSRRRMIAEWGLPAVSLGVLTFACFVWPTPWAYASWTPAQIGAMQNDGTVSLVTVQGFGIVAEYRTNRLNGRQEAKFRGRWYPIGCGIDTCWRSKNGVQ